jgi:tRNA(fMet)-specific endonuclease VapC
LPKYILDTDTCIYWLNGDQQIEKKVVGAGLANIFTTVITECELFYGAYKSSRVDKNLGVLKALREKVKTIHTTKDIAPLYGRIKAELERAGRVIDDADLLIASIVLATKSILVTNNTDHFSRVSGLQIENWS